MTTPPNLSLVPGVYNFRDVGGLPAASGETRSRVLYRSGSLAHLGDEGRATITSLRLRRVIDLRDNAEVDRQPSLIDGIDVERLSLPVFLGSSASFFDEDLSLTDMYRTIVTDSRDRVVSVVRGIVQDQPVLVHCTAGKDRTGVLAASLLLCLGATDADIVADYGRSGPNIDAIHERTRPVMSVLMAQIGIDLDAAARAAADDKPFDEYAMAQMLDVLRKRHGDPLVPLRAAGLSDALIAALREKTQVV